MPVKTQATVHPVTDKIEEMLAMAAHDGRVDYVAVSQETFDQLLAEGGEHLLVNFEVAYGNPDNNPRVKLNGFPVRVTPMATGAYMAIHFEPEPAEDALAWDWTMPDPAETITATTTTATIDTTMNNYTTATTWTTLNNYDQITQTYPAWTLTRTDEWQMGQLPLVEEVPVPEKYCLGVDLHEDKMEEEQEGEFKDVDEREFEKLLLAI